MPCDRKCPPGSVCKSFGGKSWCQSTKTRKITKKELKQQDNKRRAGEGKRSGMRAVTNFLGKLAPSNPDKKVKKKLKRTKEFRDNPGGEAGSAYKLKF